MSDFTAKPAGEAKDPADATSSDEAGSSSNGRHGQKSQTSFWARAARVLRPVQGSRLREDLTDALMTQGTPRQNIAELVLHSLEADQRQVTQLFQKLLHRPPQAGELAGYAQMLQLGGNDELVIDLVCGGDEYFQLAIA